MRKAGAKGWFFKMKMIKIFGKEPPGEELEIWEPDYGDPVEIREGEIPVFWPCGVTPQAAVENAKPPIVITHAPGHMFITDIRNADLNDYLERRKRNQ